MKKLLLILISSFIAFCLFAQNQFLLNTDSDLVKSLQNSVYFEWIDVDNDGDLDFFVTNRDGGSSLYINQGSGKYDLLVDEVISRAFGHKGKWGDYDNDGFLDLYIIKYPGRNELFRNTGNGSFEKIENFGPLITDYTVSTDFEWVDFDNDGYLDVYVGNGDKYRNSLYNNMDGTRFSKIYAGPIVEDPGDTRICTWLDIDNDGYLDLFVGNNHFGSAIYINQGPSGLFKRLEPNPYQNIGSIGAIGWTDYNGDGLPDGLVVDNTPILFLTHPDLSFTKLNLSLELPEGYKAKSISWGDYDNDGDMDLLLMSDEIYLFRNDGDYNFTRVDLPDFDNDGYFTSAKFGDFELDGNLDIYVTRMSNGSNGSSNIHFQNIGNANDWLLLKLIGSHPRFTADNARVYLYVNNAMQYRSRINHIAKADYNSMIFHYGLGSTDKVDSIVVEWPSGIKQVLKDIPTMQFLEIEEPHPPLPRSPSNLMITVDTYRKVTLSWIDNTNLEANFVLERRMDSETEYAVVAKLPRNTRSHVDFGLEAETKYHYKLYAQNKGGQSESITETVTTMAAPLAPIAPSDLKEIANTANQIKLMWNDLSTNEEGFVIERSVYDADNFEILATIGPDVTTYSDNEVIPKTKYFYRISAFIDGIFSNYSNIVEVTSGFILFKEELAIYDKIAKHLELISYDDDKFLDLFLYGFKEKFGSIVYTDLNTPSNAYTEIHHFDYFYFNTSVAIGDMNNDNELDYLILSSQKIFVYLSNEQEIHEIDVGMNFKKILIGDIDQDGKDELIVIGDGLLIFSKQDDRFLLSHSFLPNYRIDEAIIIDYDGDQDLDIIVFYTETLWSSYKSKILVNHNGTFSIEDFSINHSVLRAFPADYDNDGDMDLFLIGWANEENNYYHKTYLYRNTGSGSFELATNLSPASNAIWIDYDNDGDLDLIITSNGNITFYQNQGNGEMARMRILDIPGTNDALLCVGDYDNDGDMDLIISHQHWNIPESYIKIFKNQFVEETGRQNQAPTVPTNLNSLVDFNNVTLTWDKSIDKETPQDGLTYNVLIKHIDSEKFVVSPLSDLMDGYRKINRPGNAFGDMYVISCLADGDYIWSVQAIDNSNRASAFASFHEFSISGTKPAQPTELEAQMISKHQILLSWNDNATNETAYIIERKMVVNVSLDPGFTILDTLPINSESYIDKNVKPDTEYVYRVRVINCSGSTYAEISQKLVTSTYQSSLHEPTIYPNPASEYLVIDFKGRSVKGFVEVMLLDGRIIEKIPIPKHSNVINLDIRKYGKGLRLVRIVGDSTYCIEKVVFK
jgi:hypothetical protein